jgi:hypothetical protein
MLRVKAVQAEEVDITVVGVCTTNWCPKSETGKRCLAAKLLEMNE